MLSINPSIYDVYPLTHLPRIMVNEKIMDFLVNEKKFKQKLQL